MDCTGHHPLMESLAIGLVVLSAVLHAVWNLLGKMQAIPNLHFFIVATFFSSVILSPILFIFWQTLIQLSFLPLILLSGIFQVLYLAGLAKSYQTLDLSVAYPIIRALPVLLVPIASLVIGLFLSSSTQDKHHYQTEYQTTQWIAYGFIVIATLFLLPRHENIRTDQIQFLLLSALGTTGYSITDHFIQRNWSAQSNTSPFILGSLYIVLQGWATVLIGWIYIKIICRKTIDIRFDLSAIKAGLVISLSYFLVLCAMSFVASTGDIVAFRQISIPVGFAFGIMVMREQINTQKVISIALICAGLLMIGL
jgi:multidrug transporter EmrE-like cation transporter